MSINEFLEKLGLRPVHTNSWGMRADSDKEYAHAAGIALRAVWDLEKFQPRKLEVIDMAQRFHATGKPVIVVDVTR